MLVTLFDVPSWKPLSFGLILKKHKQIPINMGNFYVAIHDYINLNLIICLWRRTTSSTTNNVQIVI